MDHSAFPVRFAGSLRPSQTDAVATARKDLAGGGRKLYIVAPPGSGKTVLGLYLWSQCVRRPAVVLSPNSAIQAQWASSTELFAVDPSVSEPASTDPQSPGLLTSLTYQAVTMPRHGGDDLDSRAVELWQQRLIDKGQAQDPQEAAVWIDDLRRHNPAYFDERLAVYRKEIRDQKAANGEALSMLHASSLATLNRLQAHGVGLLILDECHHLMGHWGRVLAEAWELLNRPVVIGLTATPPDREGKPPEDVERYDHFFGPIDYETPLPAVVKDGFLAPYQDLVYFVRPTGEELKYLATVDREFYKLVAELETGSGVVSAAEKTPANPISAETTPDPVSNRRPLPDWLYGALAERRLPTGVVKDWESFERRDEPFARCARLFLLARGKALPPGVSAPPKQEKGVGSRFQGREEGGGSQFRRGNDSRPLFHGTLELDTLVVVLDRYIRHHLRRLPSPADHELAEQAVARLRLLGVQITETGARACDSPVGRVMAYSRAKSAGLLAILKAESRVLGPRIRAVVVADYEKTSAVTAEISHLFDEEAGGAIAAFRALLSDPETDALDPVLVTGSTVLVDDDLAERFLQEAQAWLRGEELEVRLNLQPQQGFHVLSGEGELWCPRVYVRMITRLFEQGVTRCLVGTRGLLGEGWDARKANVLVSLTAITTAMSVNQLHGRSLRLDPDDPNKLADNWDVVCIAPEFTKGLDDYHRFIARHLSMYGVTDDGAIEKGVGHVHAAFTELKPEGLEESVEVLNAEMLGRAARRDECRQRWRIGQPYDARPIRAVEVRGVGPRAGGGFPPFAKRDEPWSDASLAMAVGRAVLGALVETGLLRRQYRLHAGQRAGGYVRLFIEDAEESDSALFAESLHEALGPLDHPRYVIPRYADDLQDTWLSKVLPSIVARYFRRRRRGMAMLHAVPSALARHKDQAAIYTRHWNAEVSPGEAMYAYQGEGERLLEQARREGLVPEAALHDKEVFL